MKLISKITLALFVCVAATGLSQDEPSAAEKKAADLEAKLRQTLESSEEGARVLLELVDLYYVEGQVFGLVRSGKTFVTVQVGHPRHEEIMGKLIDGLAIASRNSDLKANILQFVDRYPNSKRAAEFHRMLAQVLEREGQRRDAADHYRTSWEKRGVATGAVDEARKAFKLYADLRSEVTAKIMGEMALKLLDQLPANVSAGQFGMAAVYQTRTYGGQYALSNQVGAKIITKKLPLVDRQAWEVHSWMGDNFRTEKQYANAIQSYRQAIAKGTDYHETHRNLIRSLYDSQAAQGDLDKAVNDYLRAFPEETVARKAEMSVLMALSKQRAGDVNGALAILNQVLREHASTSAYLFSWTEEEPLWKRAEQIYQDAAKQNPEDVHRLHYSAAFSLYRDRLKNDGAAKNLLRGHILYKSPLPNAGNEFRVALDWILDTAANDGEFQNEIRKHFDHAKKNGQNQNYSKAVEQWLAEAKRSKEDVIKNRYRWAQAEYAKFRKDPTLRLWESALQNRMKGHGAREQLLKTNLMVEQRKQLLALHAYDIRTYGDSRKRNESIPFYEQLAKLDAKDYVSGKAWVEVASGYGDVAQCKAALEHLLNLDQTTQDAVGWYHASNAARKSEDPTLQKRVLDWIRKNQQRVGASNAYAGTIIGNLRAMELEADAVAYMNEAAKRDLNYSDTQTAVRGLFELQEEGPARINFLKPYLAQSSDNHGHYASWTADEYLKLGDFANFEKVCREARKTQNGRRLRPWSFYGNAWVSHALANEEWTAEQKEQVYRVVRDMNYGRDSALGEMALLEVEGFNMKPVERLLAYRTATIEVQKDQTSYNYLFPWAQKAMGRDEFAEAAALATGLLANIDNIGVDTKGKTRSLIREAYGKMGALGMEVNADSPMAPLLEIGLHLRLGDRERALEAYTENLKRFDEFVLELPSELVAFAADSHTTAGGEQNYDRAESILRKWMVAHSESEKFSNSEKAKMQLFLARNYDRAKRFEVARSEYTTVVNRYPGTEEAVEARFGIGETQMAQKIFDHAEETFLDLSNNPISKVRIRGMFLLGVLESRKGNTEDARKIFKDVLSSMPDVSLANETLFNLAEVYGGEQRYLDQLNLLRTVGRLGQESKRWHEPGRALSIVVQDSDLGISRGHTKIPVQVTTVPGGDREMAHLSSGGAGKGLFIGEIETSLGLAQAENGVLEVSGNDLIKVDYPEDFKNEFQFNPLATGDIGIAIDAEFTMASSQIVDEEVETEAERIAREEAEEGDLRQSIQRPQNEIKPGNPIYLRVTDLDRDISGEADEVMVKVTASSGDEAKVILRETGSHSGIFEGSVDSSDLPAGALATDTAIEHNPLMAIDKDPASAWVSQPDGLTPKWLSVDLKELRTVSKGTFTTPNPLDQAPVRARLQGSHDGRFWYPLAEHPQRETAEKPAGDFKRMTQRLWHSRNASGVTNWQEMLKLAKSQPPHQESQPDELHYKTEIPIDAEERRKRKADPCGVIWQGAFIQPRDGAVRFAISGQTAGAMIDGLLIQPIVKVQRQVEFDVYLEAGLHEVIFFASTSDSGRRPIGVLRTRENPNTSQVRLTRFVPEDFDLNQAFAADLKPAGNYPLGTMSVDDEGKWEFGIEPRELRHVRMVIDEYLGQAVAINSVTVAGPNEQFIPTEQDLMQLSSNNILEITPGDQLESTYIDELPTGGEPKNRALSERLNATYYNGSITPIAYDFVRNSNGTVEETGKDLLRIDPGERITLEIVDFDLDSTGQRDKVPVKVQIGDGAPVELFATETESTSGIFKTEIDTFDPNAPVAEVKPEIASEEGDKKEEDEDAETDPAPESDLPKLAIKSGDQIYFTYRDQENTFPGHAIDRDAVIYVREPTAGRFRILETRVTPPQTEGAQSKVTFSNSESAEGAIKGVAYDVPLTVEVIDEDAARDSRSEVTVSLTLANAPEGTEPVKVACRISSAHSDLDDTLAQVRNPALHQGRFVGQVTMRLGGSNSPKLIPRAPGVSANALIGRVLPVDDSETIEDGLIGVLNLTGADTIEGAYIDELTLPDRETTLSDRARILGNGSLAATDSAYEEVVEKLQVGERLYLRLSDADKDITDERDKIDVAVESANGEKETVPLEETLNHSGIFTGSFKLKAVPQPIPGNFDPTSPELEAFFGQAMIAKYTDDRPATSDEAAVPHVTEIPVSDGTDGDLAAFTKIFGDEDLAIQTQFHIAESFFELFKSHLELDRKEEADTDLENGRRVLKELQEDYPDPKYAARVAYLLGQFAQELKNWDEAIEAYETIVKQYPDHTLAADAQYKLGQCYEEAKRLDEALEAYVTLAATYPENPLISNVMIRINEHFYVLEEFEVAAQVGAKFLERFENHEWAPRMAFRVGQCFYKDEKYKEAGLAFDDFVKRFPEDDLAGQSLFWAGESYRQGNNVPFAFRRYNRCRWDFPESDAAKYSRGRLALPEMLAQFEREAQNVDMEENQ
ncbi:MAG: tetratricopeptide repeat protein [Verrucomicrobiales bacterium]